MTIAKSKLTAQGQISVPAEVRRRLGLGAGSVLEWLDENGTVRVRRAARYDSQQIHEALFARPPAKHSVEDMDAGIRRLMHARHARR